MTKEEAIKMLKSKMDGNTDTSYEWAETVRMAIKALEKESCDNVISREAVLSMQYRIDDSATLSTRDVVNVDDIEDLPSVHPKSIECEDNISRKLLKASLVFDNKTSDMQVTEMRKIFEIIDALPSAHPECTEDYCPTAFKPVEYEDCVSREAMRKEIVNAPKWFVERDGKKCIGLLYDDVARILYGAPTIQPKQRTGHWRDTGSGQECSECGEIQYGYDNFRHFCANCGSRMEVYDATDN